MSLSRARIRVFVIEDHAATGRALKMFLEAAGCSVQVAVDIASALKLASQIDFDVVLCDLNLPDGTGWDLLEQLKKTQPQVTAIAFSAFDEPHQVERSRAAGFVTHLVKGIPADELLAAIRQAAAGATSKTRPAERKRIPARSLQRQAQAGA